MPNAIHWQVSDLCCNDWVVYAAVPFVVDLISNAQMVEVGGKWRRYYLQAAINAVVTTTDAAEQLSDAAVCCI